MEILKSMIKEEWRMHSRMFGSFMFAFFPVVVFLFSFLGSMMLPVFYELVPDLSLSYIIQLLFLFFGLSIGSFGLLGREFMNRRFGQASLIAYSSRNLPVSEKVIFSNFIVKDAIFYFILWILPFSLGYGVYSIIFSEPLTTALNLLVATFTAFAAGLSIAFLLSTIYANSRKAFFAFAIIAASIAVLSGMQISYESLSVFPNASVPKIIFYLIACAAACSVSIMFMKSDYPERKKKFTNSFRTLSKILNTKYSHFMSKDMLDISRSEGGVGKIIFSFLMPLAIVWLSMNVMMKFIPQANYTLLFGIFLGVISSTIYNWLTEFDVFTSYSFLPVKVSDVIKSKVKSYAMINIISVIMLALVALQMGQPDQFIVSAITMVSVSFYTLSVIILLAGLYPNIMLYNAKIFLQYIALNSPMMLVLIFTSLLSPSLLYFSFILIPIGYYAMKKGLAKWDSWESPSF